MAVFANPASCQYCSANLLLAPSGRGEKQCWPGDGMMASNRLFVLPAVSVLNRLAGGEPRGTRCPSDTSSRVSLAQLGPVLIRGRDVGCILWQKKDHQMRALRIVWARQANRCLVSLRSRRLTLRELLRGSHQPGSLR